jgi:hypothetical protein
MSPVQTQSAPTSAEEIEGAFAEGVISAGEALRLAGEEIARLRDQMVPLSDTLESFELLEERYRPIAERAIERVGEARQIAGWQFDWITPGADRALRRTFKPDVVEHITVALRDRGIADLAQLLDEAGAPETARKSYLRISKARAPKAPKEARGKAKASPAEAA